MSSFWKHVNRVIQNTDIVIEVLDARMVEQISKSILNNDLVILNRNKPSEFLLTV